MAVFKRVLCTDCGKQLGQTAKETSREWQAKRCPCGGSPKLSSKWYVSAYLPLVEGGTKKYVKAVSTNKKEAEAHERQMLSKRDEGERISASKDPTLNDFLPTWEAWLDRRLRDGKLSEGSHLSYVRRTHGHIAPHFGRMLLRDISTDSVEDYIDGRLEQGVRPATVNREVATLKRIVAIAVQKKALRYHPIHGLEMLEENNERDRHLLAAEIDKLLLSCQHATAPEHLYPIVVVGLNTGLRIHGVLTLKWEDIDWRTNEIVQTVKGKKVVRIPMTAVLRDTLNQWRTRDGVKRITGWVFPSTKKANQPILITSNFGLKAAMDRAGIEDATFHTLRHTFATLFLEQFPDKIEVLRVILGHSSSYITRRYAHLTERTKHEAMSSFRLA